MDTSPGKRFGKWLVFESLGRGGQGEVFLVRQLTPEHLSSINQAIKNLSQGPLYHGKPAEASAAEVIFRGMHEFSRAPIGALKCLHSPDRASHPERAVERFEREVEVLAQLTHPALIQLIDSNVKERWLVMEYHRSGTLTRNIEKFKADPVRCVEALRPLVEGVAAIHEKGVFHRDIKPDNIFVADDGRLVLGDWGLVIDLSSDQPRLTATYENAGSWQWMPAWASGARNPDVDGEFDSFCLGKVLWAMISGRSFLRYHYFDVDEYNLEVQFPNDPRMRTVNRFLARCVVERKGRGVRDAGKLLSLIDQLLADLRVSITQSPNNPAAAWQRAVQAAAGKKSSSKKNERVPATVEQLHAKAKAIVDSITKMSQQERDDQPTGTFGNDYNALLAATRKHKPELASVLPPQVTVNVSDTTGESFTQEKYKEILTFSSQLVGILESERKRS